MTKATNKRPATKAPRRPVTKAASQPSATKTTQPSKKPSTPPSTKPSTQPAAKPTPQPAPKSSATLIVLGYDGEQKPRGARFIDADPDLVRKAAIALDLKVYEVPSSSDLAAVARKLPVGKINASGQGLVPNVGQDLYSEVVVALAVKIRRDDDPATPPVAQGLPKTWDEIAPGHLVVA